MPKKPTKPIAPRNPFVVPAKHRQSGAIKTGPRGGARNEEREWLEEWESELEAESAERLEGDEDSG